MPDSSGSWSLAVLPVGGQRDTGRRYWVDLYMMDASESAPLEGSDQSNTLQQGMPPSSIYLNEVAVIRGASNATGPGGNCY